MDPEPMQAKLAPPDNPSQSSTPFTPVLAAISALPSPAKVTRPRRCRKKVTRAAKLTVDPNTVESSPSTQAFPDSNNNDAEQIYSRETILQNKLDYNISTDAAMCGEEKQAMPFSESPSRILDKGKSFNAPLGESPVVPPIIPSASSTPGTNNTGVEDEPTTFLLPLCENGALPCQQMMPSSQQVPGIAPPCGIPDEPPTFVLPLRERPVVPCQQVMPTSQRVPGLPPPGFPMKLVHFGPPPHLLPMGQFFGHPPLVAPFQPQPPPMARLMGPPPSVGHFVGPPHHFLRTPNPTNTYFRPMFWDPRSPYGAHPYASNVLPAQMTYPGYVAGPQRRRPATAKPRKPRRKAANTGGVDPELNAAPPSMDEPLPRVTLYEILPQETPTPPETFPQNTTTLENSVQETIMNEYLPQETIINDHSPQNTMTYNEFPQEAKTDDTFTQGTITDELLLTQETVLAVSMDVPDMCNEVEVESTLLLNGEEGLDENSYEPEPEDVNQLSTNMMPPLDLNHEDIDREAASPSPTPVKTRRMSHKKEQMKLVFDRKSEAMVKAAKGLFTKRTRTLYTWLYPNTSKREVKASVSKAWDLLPESEKAYYLAQVDGRLGIHPGLMVNPQLEGLVKLPDSSTALKSRAGADRTSEDGSSSDYGSSEHSDTENNHRHHNNNDNNNNEVARAVRNLFASNGDVETWTSFVNHDADNKRFRRRKRRKSSENGRSADDAKRPTGERDAELECELAKFRQILENDNNLIDEDSYWRVVPESNPEELFLDIMQE